MKRYLRPACGEPQGWALRLALEILQDRLKRGDAADDSRHRLKDADQCLDTPPESLRIGLAAILCAGHFSLQGPNGIDGVITVVRRDRRIMIPLKERPNPGQLVPQLRKPRLLQVGAQRISDVYPILPTAHVGHRAFGDRPAGDDVPGADGVLLPVRCSFVPGHFSSYRIMLPEPSWLR